MTDAKPARARPLQYLLVLKGVHPKERRDVVSCESLGIQRSNAAACEKAATLFHAFSCGHDDAEAVIYHGYEVERISTRAPSKKHVIPSGRLASAPATSREEYDQHDTAATAALAATYDHDHDD